MSDRVFYSLITSFVFGVAFWSFFNLGLSFLALFFLISIVVALIDRKFVLISISLVLFSLGALRMDFAQDRNFILNNSLGKKAEITGIIIEEPSKRENSIQLIIKPENSDEKVLITSERADIFNYGDLISAQGVLKTPKNFITDNNREFDYINYLSKDEIFYSMLFPKIEVLDTGRGNFIKEKLFSIKRTLISKMNEIIPSPESEYLSGLIFGVKESLGKDLEGDFRRTGLIHVVVLSGYNVTIIADSILKSLSFLPIHTSLALGALSIVFFAIMTGASATIVRASVMALIVIMGRVFSRRYDITRSLFIAGFLMILHNPKILIFDPSFQLSFLATMGLIHFSPIVEGKLKFIPEKYQLRKLISATLATQFFILPLLLNKIGEISLIAPVSNILVLPFIPFTMFFGFITSILGLALNFLGFIPGFLSFILLNYQIRVVEMFSSIPFSSVGVKVFPIWLTFLIYAFYFYLYKRSKST
ncbi:MAG: hypothetical protein CMI58_04820 [Parcubacteria group bacterium]|jgi:competence protein ComEC|nr:hypothetical protein [Parcubacteria group bacterium]|tara:strand:- start:2991 stop:4418 length:1428 start_codon:yes stop_codon:yes gene_type:complete